MNDQKIKCGDCRYFVKDGQCDATQSDRYKRAGRPFGEAPFWVWSDCYSDKEQVRSDVETTCCFFESQPAPAATAE